jgi:hypothetical protein
MQHSSNDDAGLQAALHRVAEQDRALGASLDVHARLLAEVRSIRLARRRRLFVATCAMAAALVLVVLVAAWPLVTRHRSRIAPSPAIEVDTRAASNEVVTEFFPLTYSSVPVSGAQIVRVDVPRTTLVLFGLEPIDVLGGTASGSVLADVLVGDDGLARGVRFVRSVEN